MLTGGIGYGYSLTSSPPLTQIKPARLSVRRCHGHPGLYCWQDVRWSDSADKSLPMLSSRASATMLSQVRMRATARRLKSRLYCARFAIFHSPFNGKVSVCPVSQFWGPVHPEERRHGRRRGNLKGRSTDRAQAHFLRGIGRKRLPHTWDRRFRLSSLPQGDDGGAPTAGFGGGVPEIGHEIRARQNRTHHLALHPDAASVDDPQRLEPQPVRLPRYSSTTAFTSRGGMLCRSKTSVMGMRIGSIKTKGPVSRSRPGRIEIAATART